MGGRQRRNQRPTKDPPPGKGDGVPPSLAGGRDVRALRREWNGLLQQAPVAAALTTGPQHVFEAANPLFLQVAGREKLVGQTYLEAFPELASTDLPVILDRAYQTGVPVVTSEMRVPRDHRGPRECHFRFHLQPVRDAAGAVQGLMAVAVDITEQVAARRVLERAHAERDELLRELENASRAKDEFLAMLGHELRNPLSPILTALQLMRMRGDRRGDREREIIERQVQHLVALVDDLLDISRITRGKIALKPERLHLADVVAKAIEMASPLIEQRRHRLAVEVPPDLMVDGDLSRLAQVLANLLTNAAKYTAPEGHISVRAQPRDGQAWIVVRDTGEGIAPEDLPRVFEAFTQEPQTSARSHGGLGLGLAIVKSLVAMHDGTITLHSHGKGHGTECVLRLPLAQGFAPQASRDTETVAPATPADGREVLVVDDNEDAAETLGEALRTLGHRVQVASDAPEALAMATDYVPEVALLDLGLPVIDGCELAQRLRLQPGWSHVRLIALTGYGLERDRQRTRRAGFDAHLVKPVDLRTLHAALQSGTHEGGAGHHGGAEDADHRE
jgi:PAS domain S-box-containing protein